MEDDPHRRGHLPSGVLLMRLFGSPVQEILCATSLVFVRPARKNQVSASGDMWEEGALPFLLTVDYASKGIYKVTEARVISSR